MKFNLDVILEKALQSAVIILDQLYVSQMIKRNNKHAKEPSELQVLPHDLHTFKTITVLLPVTARSS